MCIVGANRGEGEEGNGEKKGLMDGMERKGSREGQEWKMEN